ncbi:MAG TPA: glycosyltransferase family 2 protein [Anaerolineae bacterium]|nr:glycosyltransferase family 2 protein [Anaerolineae bacterium]
MGAETITAVVLTLNEEEHIGDCLASLGWADKRLVFDSFSQDKTVSLAEAAGAQVVQHPFENYAQQRNAALAAVETDWVFFVDADERSTPALANEIRLVVAERPERGWYVPRHNYIFGKLTLGAGWYPDYQARLFECAKVRYERPVHEVAVVEGELGYLEEPLVHYNYRNVAQFHKTQKGYTAYEAGILKGEIEAGEGRKPKIYTPWTQAVRHFWWRYVTLAGYRDGWHGLRLSGYMGYYEWVKYWRVWRG